MFRAVATTALLMGAGMAAAMAQELPNSPMALTRTFEQRFNARDLDGLAALYRRDGTSTDVATRRPDGKWLYAIDNPRGLEATAQ